MQIALIGLGKMGFNLGLNMHQHGHQVLAYDLNQKTLESIKQKGISTAASIEKLLQPLKGKKVIWMMIPSGEAVDLTIQQVAPLLRSGDILIDGGNSNYKDTVRRAKQLEASGIDYLDCGTSGGMEGALNGICAMVGGKKVCPTGYPAGCKVRGRCIFDYDSYSRVLTIVPAGCGRSQGRDHSISILRGSSALLPTRSNSQPHIHGTS